MWKISCPKEHWKTLSLVVRFFTWEGKKLQANLNSIVPNISWELEPTIKACGPCDLQLHLADFSAFIVIEIDEFLDRSCLCFKTSPRAKPCHMKWVWFAWKWSWRWNTSIWTSAVSHADSFWYRGKRQSEVAYCFGFCPDTDLEIFDQIFSYFVPFLFQGKGNSEVKAVKDDKGASNSSADYENHSSPNSSEQQIDSFDELNLEDKQGSHWS